MITIHRIFFFFHFQPEFNWKNFKRAIMLIGFRISNKEEL